MKKTTPLRFALLLTFGAGIAVSCANTSADGGTDSNTHWLDTCRTDADCGGLTCECGMCTKPCVTRSSCNTLSASASCAAVPGCSSKTTVCLRNVEKDAGPTHDAAQPMTMTGGDCPSGATAGGQCFAYIAQCWLPCSSGLRGQLVCSTNTWFAGKGLFPCGNEGTGGTGGAGGSTSTGGGGAGITGGDCPASVRSDASCDGRVEQCWTQCNDGFKSQFTCSDGTWTAGHGLFPCSADSGTPKQDAGTPKQDAGGSLPGVSTSCTGSADCVATDSICCPRCDTEPTLSTKIGINRSSVSTYQDELCATAGACPPCVPPPGTIDAFCRGGTCEAQDLGKYKTCTKDADCKLVPKDCWACGTLPATAFVALADEAGFVGDRCATVDCAGCPDGLHVADASRATCNTTYGYCEIAPPR